MRYLQNGFGTVFSLVAAFGSLAAQPAFATDDDPNAGETGAWVAPTLQGDGHRLAWGQCALPNSTLTAVRFSASGRVPARAGDADDVIPEFLPQLSPLVQGRDLRVRIEQECKAAEDASESVWPYTAWLPIDANSDHLIQCPDSHPYMVKARCTTHFGEGPEARDPEGLDIPDIDTDPAVHEDVAAERFEVYSPSRTAIAEVTANGTGCPAGTWNSEISDDGKTFKTAFSAYKASIGVGDAIDVKDCQLSLRVRNAENTSYALDSFTFDAFYRLDTGVTADVTSKHYIQGDPANSITTGERLAGPAANTYSHFSGAGDLATECGEPRDLEILTRVVLKNNQGATAKGSVNVEDAAGATLVVKLASTDCE